MFNYRGQTRAVFNEEIKLCLTNVSRQSVFPVDMSRGFGQIKNIKFENFIEHQSFKFLQLSVFGLNLSALTKFFKRIIVIKKYMMKISRSWFFGLLKSVFQS